MLKAAFILIVLATVSCGKDYNALIFAPQKMKLKLKVPVIEENRNTIVLDEIKVFEKKPIALVLYGDTIYHCSSLTTDSCGVNAECGKYKLNCLKNPTIEYLSKNKEF